MATNPNAPKEPEKGLLDKYYSFATQVDEDGKGHSRLWVNNGVFFIAGYVVGKMMTSPAK